ncbi:TonB-dependent receptor [Brumimicrobium mesophilum]|uniref:TonB-dependent receptor n=1 Tax=Brumimicrobium mesophilum TaxID=392717 RepID=UPI000D142FCF|nr:carboxypeptidase-like regulatory domain-containing protein [Brumimicrobium mesophilum]
MKQNCLIVLTFFLTTVFHTFSQDITISGTITDGKNGEDLFGASVIATDMTNTGARTNVYGFYSLTIPVGRHQLAYRNSGFEDQIFDLVITQDTVINLELFLLKEVQEIEEVNITSKRSNSNITSAQMEVTRLDPQSIKTIPILFGEQDIMKTLQLTPGVKGGGEGSAGFYVRGGGADQNLILLDESTVYNASHLLGFFSVFNSDAIKDVALYKSGIPAEYGGRASSVMDVRMRDGNNKEIAASGGIGLISSRLTIEGPLVKDKSSFIISGRRSYADLFLVFSPDEDIRDTKLFFYDLNAKVNYKLSDKDRIYLSGYFGRDKFGLSDDFGFDWGNKTGTVRWNHLFNDKLFMNTSIIYSAFDYQFSIGQGEDGFGIRSSIRDFNVKQDYNYYLNTNNSLKFGVNAIHHTFEPGVLESGDNVGFNQIDLEKRHALEVGAYLQNEQKVGNRWAFMYGLRYSGFNYMGKGTAYEYAEDGAITSEESYDSFESIKYYQGLEPRLSASFIINESNSIKVGYNRIFQYIHQLSNTTTSSPTDVWVPTSNNVKPQIGDQIAVGYYKNFKKDEYQVSVETYYKWLQNQIDYRPNANLILNGQIERELVYGEGRAYGIEFQIKKTKGDFTGWFNYTLSRALRSFDEIDGGQEFSARQDRIHDLNLVLTYNISKKFVVSTSFVYYTGDAVTFPSALYEMDGYEVPYVGSRNGNRLPDYHRLDLGLTWYLKDKKNYKHNLSFSIYNVYNRENAFAVRFVDDFEDNTTGQTQAVQTALFKIIPSITYNFNFK